MTFQPQTGQVLNIEQAVYKLAAHPFAPSMPYGQEGRAAIVYQLITGQEKRAFKVFKARFRVPGLVMLAEQLEPFSSIPGLQVCKRTVLTPQEHGLLLRQYPDLIYAVLMPWVEGPTWMQVLLRKTALTAEESLKLARSFADTLAKMEQRRLAHCDLSSPNLILPSLASKAAVATEPQVSVALVDVEQMYGPSLEKPETLPAGSSGYGHESVGQGVWNANADRFAGALLLAEMLGWCDTRIRDAAWGESYFDPGELQNDGKRYQILFSVLEHRWGSSTATLLQRAWYSDALAACPTFGEWLVSLPDQPIATSSLPSGTMVSSSETPARVVPPTNTQWAPHPSKAQVAQLPPASFTRPTNAAEATAARVERTRKGEFGEPPALAISAPRISLSESAESGRRKVAWPVYGLGLLFLVLVAVGVFLYQAQGSASARANATATAVMSLQETATISARASSTAGAEQAVAASATVQAAQAQATSAAQQTSTVLAQAVAAQTADAEVLLRSQRATVEAQSIEATAIAQASETALAQAVQATTSAEVARQTSTAQAIALEQGRAASGTATALAGGTLILGPESGTMESRGGLGDVNRVYDAYLASGFAVHDFVFEVTILNPADFGEGSYYRLNISRELAGGFREGDTAGSFEINEHCLGCISFATYDPIVKTGSVDLASTIDPSEFAANTLHLEARQGRAKLSINDGPPSSFGWPVDTTSEIKLTAFFPNEDPSREIKYRSLRVWSLDR